LYCVENSLWRRLWNCRERETERERERQRERERECVINDVSVNALT
jgi:hypothetical protein